MSEWAKERTFWEVTIMAIGTGVIGTGILYIILEKDGLFPKLKKIWQQYKTKLSHKKNGGVL